jgi:peptidyl-tRNA hydrolase, PTH1 family
MKIIVGLGNPGRSYEHNRHNIGFRCLDYFAKVHAIKFSRRECHARTGIGKIGIEEVLLAKPGTFVNRSGDAVNKLMVKYGVALPDLLVICDDLDLPLGRIRVRQRGGSGGHNGLKSIISAAGGTSFPRIRVGIGRPVMPERLPDSSEDAIVNYVLSDFLRQEDEAVTLAIKSVAEAMECAFTQGLEAAMNFFN